MQKHRLVLLAPILLLSICCANGDLCAVLNAVSAAALLWLSVAIFRPMFDAGFFPQFLITLSYWSAFTLAVVLLCGSRRHAFVRFVQSGICGRHLFGFLCFLAIFLAPSSAAFLWLGRFWTALAETPLAPLWTSMLAILWLTLSTVTFWKVRSALELG